MPPSAEAISNIPLPISRSPNSISDTNRLSTSKRDYDEPSNGIKAKPLAHRREPADIKTPTLKRRSEVTMRAAVLLVTLELRKPARSARRSVRRDHSGKVHRTESVLRRTIA